MVRYTSEEKRDMYELYIKCNRNSIIAKQRYEQLHPERNQPNLNIFRRLSQNLLQYNSFNRTRVQYVRRREPVSDINVLAQIAKNPEVSSRAVAAECNLSRSRVSQIIKGHGYDDFKYLPVQKLYPNDPQRRLQFSNWYQHKLVDNHNFSHEIIWGDETTFTNSAMFNRKNKHYYATVNPKLVQEVRHQYRFSLNLWCGLLDNKVLGPYFIDGSLTARKYLEILEEMLDDLPLDHRNSNLWFQQDGAGVHNAAVVEDYLNDRFTHSWIGTRGPVAWAARSPDLNPLDFYLWGFLKIKFIIDLTQQWKYFGKRSRTLSKQFNQRQ